MASLMRLLGLWDNPVFNRFRRSQLRAKRAIFWYLATLIVTSFVVSLIYIVQTIDLERPEEYAARFIWPWLLIIQMLILLFKGTGRTASGLIQDKIDQTLDYQRLTPVSPLRNLIGYLFGLPVLEYAMLALTLPHLAFIVAKGNIPLDTVFSVYLAFFVCAIFYHMTAIAVGMVMTRWIWGFLLSIFAVAFLNIVLPLAGPQFGLKFLQYLSVLSVIGEKVAPLIVLPPDFLPGPGFRPPQAGAPFEFFGDPVPFFKWTISPFWFTLGLQSALIVTFVVMAVRRWQKATRHSLSKTYALGILAVFIVLVTGNLWPAITGDSLPFALLFNANLNQVNDLIAIGLPIVYSIATWFLCLFLFFNVVPTHPDYVRGVRRARKLNRRAARPWDDDATNLAFMSLFVVVTLAGYWVIRAQMVDAGFLSFVEGAGIGQWQLPFVLGLVLLYSLLLLQVLQFRGFVLTALLLWLLPILIAIVSGAAIEDVTRFQTVVASLSPLATVLMTGLLPLGQYPSVGGGSQYAALLTGIYTGIVLLVVQISALALRWRLLCRALA